MLDEIWDNSCTVSDTIYSLYTVPYEGRDLLNAVNKACAIISSDLYLTDVEEEFLIRFVFNATGVNHGS